MLFPSLFRHLKWNLGNDRRSRSRRRHVRPRFVPRLEALEDRTVLSTLTVTSAADNGSAGTLRAVLAAAKSGDTIQFASKLDGQTITLIQGQLVVNQSLDIAGPGANNLTISGNAASRIFDITTGATVTISGLTLARGLATDGASILNAGNLTLSEDVLNRNVAQGITDSGLFSDGGGRGGGVENQASATLAVSQCSFIGNQALGGPNGGNAFGGGIYNEAGTISVTQSLFTGNQAVAANGGSVGVAVTLPAGISATLLGVGAGAGVWNDGGSVTVTNSILRNNLDQGGNNGDATGSTAMLPMVGTATGGAIGSGAFFTTATPSVAIAGSTLTGNQSLGGTNVFVSSFFPTDAGSGRGGAIGAVAGDVSVSNSTISGNLAETGAFFTLIQGGSVVAFQGFFAFGGGIDDEFDLDFFTTTFPMPPASTSLSIADSTISDNVVMGKGLSAGGTGGGLAATLVNAQVTNCTVSNNRAIGAPGGGFITFSGTSFPLGGGLAVAGGMFGEFGSLTIRDTTVKANLAQAGSGGTTATAGSGGLSLGAGISTNTQTFVLTNSTLSGNQAVAGDGFNGNSGGFSAGGGLEFGFGGTATISGTTFSHNLAQGGAGSFFGGGAVGAGIDDSSSPLQMTNCTFTGNKAIGGGGGVVGGISEAGGLGIFGASATISNATFVLNLAQGGAGQAGGFGGEAVGGALLLATFGAPANVSTCNFVQNVAQGGAGGGFSSNGQGGALFISGETTTTVSTCNFVKDVAQGGAGSGGNPGGPGAGGGIDVDFFSSLQLSQSTFTGDEAIGGSGGAGTSGGAGSAGGDGMGGGLNVDLGSSAAVSNTLFIRDLAQGGAGGAGDTGGAGGLGGSGQGGALGNTLSTTTVSNSSFLLNVAQGGAGGTGGAGASGGVGGAGQGGAVYNALADGFGFFPEVTSLTVSISSIALNQAIGGVGGAGGAGGIGGSGGNGEGGGFFISLNTFTGSVTLTISGSSLTGNAAQGGISASGGNGGNGFGGGIFNDDGATDTVLSSVIAGNQADGGAAGAGGSAGQGIGGGVYNLGTFFLDAASIILGNDASTSNDNVFGPITPI
jgi:hypothetical protein